MVTIVYYSTMRYYNRLLRQNMDGSLIAVHWTIG